LLAIALRLIFKIYQKKSITNNKFKEYTIAKNRAHVPGLKSLIIKKELSLCFGRLQRQCHRSPRRERPGLKGINTLHIPAGIPFNKAIWILQEAPHHMGKPLLLLLVPQTSHRDF